MCEKRTRKIKKGSHLTRLREARRIQRLQLIASPATTSDESNSLPPIAHQHQPTVDKVAQNRVILELAWRTILLMHKNKLIQQKIVALQKETSEFVASVMNNPQTRHQFEFKRCAPQGQIQQVIENKNLALKVEPNV